MRAERSTDWQTAYDAYADAVEFDPASRDYVLRRDVARSRLVQTKVGLAERDAISGRLANARKELLDARYLDPSNTIVRERLAQLSAITPGDQQSLRPSFELQPEVHLDYRQGTRSFDYRGDTQGVYQQVADQFGVQVAFDVDLVSRSVRFQVTDVDFPTAMRILGDMTGTFWRPLTSRLFFVSMDTPQKRKDYDASVVKTIQLPASQTPEEMTEMLRLVREISGIIRSDVDLNSRTITVRASPQAVAVANALVEDLEKPAGELVLEMDVLEVDKNYAAQIGITPPQTSKVATLSSQEITEAQQSLTGLVDVIGAVFGLPSSLSGLSSTQVASLLSSGTISESSLIPPFVAFGGNSATFLATMPGATANLSRMLSLVEHGQRILLRAQDGQAASFFVGDRVPVELSSFDASLSGTGNSIAGLSPSNFPLTNYDTGVAPSFVATASLRNNGINDLIVTNFTDNTISVLLGDGTTSATSGTTLEGDGTFGTQTTFPTGVGPASIATGAFRAQSGNDNIDLAVANQTANTISILLGNGDGTFQPKTDLPAGNEPVNVIAADLHDVNGNGSLDLVVANHNDSTIYIYQGNGDGTFKTPTIIQLPVGYAPSAIAAGNFNNDSHLDLAVADEGNGTVSVFLGNGDGTFQPRVDYLVGSSPAWVSAADVNGDGVLDLEVANKGSDTVSVLLGNGTTVTSTSTGTSTIPNGTFETQSVYPAGGEPTSIAVGDYNVSGLPSLAVTDLSDNAVSILLNLGSGTFGPNYEIPVGTSPVSIVAAEFDQSASSNLDVAIANNGSNNVSVILNLSSFSGVGSGSPGAFNSGAFPGVQYLDIGLKVKATPRIHADGEVTVAFEFEESSLSSQSYNTIPVINSETLTQTVRVKENETAMLAGIREPSTSNETNGWPGIGDVPGLGAIASDQTVQNADTELLILVTPRMVRLAPRKDQVIYAGQGSLDNAAPGSVGAPLPLPGNTPPPPQGPPGPGQVPQPGGPQPPAQGEQASQPTAAAGQPVQPGATPPGGEQRQNPQQPAPATGNPGAEQTPGQQPAEPQANPGNAQAPAQQQTQPAGQPDQPPAAPPQ